jgi:hypothetical protein
MRAHTKLKAPGQGLLSLLAALASLLMLGCQSTPLPPLRTAPQVDLARFMGDWYVIAVIPTFIEKQAFNAVESYRLESDGSIATTFTFNKGALDGAPKRYHPTLPGTCALCGRFWRTTASRTCPTTTNRQ